MSTNEERGERSKAGGASGSGDDSPCQGGEGQSLSEPPAPLPPLHTTLLLFLFFFLNPTPALFTLGFEVDCELYLLIPIVTVAYAYFAMHMGFFPPPHPPLPAPSPSARCPWQPAVTGGRVLIGDVSLCTEPVANTFVAVFAERLQIDGYCCGSFIRLEKAAALLTGGLCVKGVKTSPLDGQIDNYKRYILVQLSRKT